MFWEILCTKKHFKILAEATIDVLNARPRFSCAIFPLQNKQKRFSWCLTKGFVFLKRHKNQLSIRDSIGDAYCLEGFSQKKSVFMSIHVKKMMKAVTHFCNAKGAGRFWRFFLMTKNRQLCWLAVMGHNVLTKNESCLRKRKTISFSEDISPPITICHTRTHATKGKYHSDFEIILSTSH